MPDSGTAVILSTPSEAATGSPGKAGLVLWKILSSVACVRAASTLPAPAVRSAGLRKFHRLPAAAGRNCNGIRGKSHIGGWSTQRIFQQQPQRQVRIS